MSSDCYLVKLYNQLEEEKAKSEGRVSIDVRLTEKVIDPKRQLTMNVSLAKRSMEQKTLDYDISKMCDDLGITADFVKMKTAEAREKHPFMKSLSPTDHQQKLFRHSHHLEVALFCMIILLRIKLNQLEMMEI